MSPYDESSSCGAFLKTDGQAPCDACPVRSLTLCSSLERPEMDALSGIMQTRDIKAGETVFDEGEAANALYNITSGAVKLYKLLPDGRRQITGFLFAGDFLGLAVGDHYAYSAEAISKVTLCRFPRIQLDRLMDQYPKLQRRLFSIASNELAAAQDQMLLLGRKTAREKICSFLGVLSRSNLRRNLTPEIIHLPMSRADIADYLGLTTETVSRSFTQLKTSGLIRLMDGHRVKLEDIEALAHDAESG